MFYNVFYSLKTHYILSELKKNNVVYCVQYINFRSNLNRLEDNGIKYTILCIFFNNRMHALQTFYYHESKKCRYNVSRETL